MRLMGAVRKVDDLGRVVLPSDIRKVLDIQPQDSVELFVEDDSVILQRFMPNCLLCGGVENLVRFRGKNICSVCRKALGDFG